MPGRPDVGCTCRRPTNQCTCTRWWSLSTPFGPGSTSRCQYGSALVRHACGVCRRAGSRTSSRLSQAPTIGRSCESTWRVHTAVPASTRTASSVRHGSRPTCGSRTRRDLVRRSSRAARWRFGGRTIPDQRLERRRGRPDVRCTCRTWLHRVSCSAAVRLMFTIPMRAASTAAGELGHSVTPLQRTAAPAMTWKRPLSS